jgi:septal ring factor EnvC (AmiA/AmiB activator)
MKKWRKRAREWRTWARQNRETANDWRENYEMLEKKRDAALNKAEELRRDNLRMATELARVQEVCDATVVQVQKHAATIIDLRERENVALRDAEEYRHCLAEVRASLARIEVQRVRFAGWLAQPEMAELTEFINGYPTWDRCSAGTKEEG